jgi:hypothetical protein
MRRFGPWGNRLLNYAARVESVRIGTAGAMGGSNEKGRFASAPAVAAASGNGFDEGAGGLKQHLQFLADFHKSQTCRQPGGGRATVVSGASHH